jgi:hypothetical protein
MGVPGYFGHQAWLITRYVREKSASSVSGDLNSHVSQI